MISWTTYLFREHLESSSSPAVCLAPHVEFVEILRAVGEEDDLTLPFELRGEPQAEREGVQAELLGGSQLYEAVGGLLRKHQRAACRSARSSRSTGPCLTSSPLMLLRHFLQKMW